MRGLPRHNLVRALYPGAFLNPEGAPGDPEDRDTDTAMRAPAERGKKKKKGDGSLGTMYGHFAVFGRWTEIDSIFEGNFMEQVAPGTFRKTFREQRDTMRALFQHGRDTQIGSKPLGPIDDLREDGEGAYYEVPLLDTGYNRDLEPGLRAGLYGASFRFHVIREDLNRDPGSSTYNPKGLPERTIREAQVLEFGPVTFPAYAEATAGVRSLTDEDLIQRMLETDPGRLHQLAQSLGYQLVVSRTDATSPEALPADAAPGGTSEGRRESPTGSLVVTLNPNRRRATA